MDTDTSTPTRRVAGDLLKPVADSGIEEDTAEFVLADRPGSPSMSSSRQNAESAIHFLTTTSTKPAVLLARDWHLIGMPFAFEHLALYQEVAAASNCFIVTIDRPEAGGIERLLFAAKMHGLTDEEYLACIDTDAIEAPESHWASYRKDM